MMEDPLEPLLIWLPPGASDRQTEQMFHGNEAVDKFAAGDIEEEEFGDLLSDAGVDLSIWVPQAAQTLIIHGLG